MKIYPLLFLLIIPLFFGCISKSDSSISFDTDSAIQLTEFQKDSVEGMQWMRKIHDSINEPILNHLDYECYRFSWL